TVFRVDIPLSIPSAQISQQPDCQDAAPVPDYDFSGKTILLVEDHQLNILVARKLLEFKHAAVVVAENGQLGLDAFTGAAEGGFDAVLMDIRMPVMDGLSCARRIRALESPWAKRVPIIAMSANAFDEDRQKSAQAGMNAHLSKPIDGELLYRTLYSYFEKED
ncbi:MAG: response regulator, partial [Oscillospiraceae bacterium]